MLTPWCRTLVGNLEVFLMGLAHLWEDEEAGTSGSELKDPLEDATHPSLVQRMFLLERTFLSAGFVLPDSSTMSRKLHTTLESHLYKYLTFLA